MHFKAVLFDMDGVIVDNNDYHRRAWQAFMLRHGIELSVEDYNRRVSGRVNSELLRMLFGNHLSDQEVTLLGEEKELIFRELYEAHLHPIDGLHDFLKTLKRIGFKLAVGTSAPVSNMDFILDGLGIRSYFDALVHQEMIERGKPDPEIYQFCMKSIGMQPEECLVFEDSLSGIQAGIASGASVIGVTTTHGNNELKGTLINIANYRDERLGTIFCCDFCDRSVGIVGIVRIIVATRKNRWF